MASRELNILIKAKNLASSVLKGVKGDLNGLGRIGSKAGRNLAQNFERGLIATGVGVAGFAGLAIKTAADFEDAFAGVIKTVDETELAAAGLSFEDLLDDFRRMAREMPIAFEELSAIGEAAGALGIRAQDIDEFTETVAKLGVTTDLTSDAAATALGHLGTILGLTGDDFEQLADSLVALGNDGASTESQIIGIAERFAAAGNQAGLAKEDILALSSTAASMGVDVEAAGSSLSRIFNQTTTNIGTANEKAEAFAGALGLSFADFKEAWRSDALGTFQDLLQHLGELDQFQAASLLKDIGITGVRDINAIQLLAGGYEELTDQLKTAREAQGALNEEAGKKFATTASQWTRFKNVLRDAGFVIGRELLPIVNELMTDFTNFLATDENQGKLKQFAKDFAQNIREVAEYIRSLDWAKIADTLASAASFGKALLDAFLGMPSWVQQAVVTGWGLNKLTGGAVGDLVGHLASGLIKGVLGINAGVVNINAATVNGGPGGVPGGRGGGGGGFLGNLFKWGVLPVAAGAVGAHIGNELIEPQIAPARNFEQSRATAVLESGDADRIRNGLQAVEDQLNVVGSGITNDLPSQIALALDIGGVRTALEKQRDDLKAELTNLNTSEGQTRAEGRIMRDRLNGAIERQGAEAKSFDGAMLGNLRTIAAKRTEFNPVINVHNTVATSVNVNTAAVVRAVQVYSKTVNARQGTVPTVN